MIYTFRCPACGFIGEIDETENIGTDNPQDLCPFCSEETEETTETAKEK